MAIVFIIGFFIVTYCFCVISKVSRIVLVLLFLVSLYYWYSISAVFHGGIGPSFDELKIALMLMSANVGGLILAVAYHLYF